MQSLTLSQPHIRPARLSLLRDQWETSEPSSSLARHPLALDDVRLALNQAERVIEAQEERIRQLENLAMTDELTGLLNRRGFILTLERELAFARRDKGAQGVLVMIDLDGFKSINDLWGHAAGDDYLQTVAHVLLNDVRDHDVVARLGGDEFAVILTRIDELTGITRMMALEHSFNSRAMQWNDRPLPLKASFGMAAFGPADTPESIVAAADLKLYAHKARKKG